MNIWIQKNDLLIEYKLFEIDFEIEFKLIIQLIELILFNEFNVKLNLINRLPELIFVPWTYWIQWKVQVSFAEWAHINEKFSYVCVVTENLWVDLAEKVAIWGFEELRIPLPQFLSLEQNQNMFFGNIN